MDKKPRSTGALSAGADTTTSAEPGERQESRDGNVRSILKAVSVLDCFSRIDRQLSVAEIAARIGIPRATAHRIVATLQEAGLLERERERDHYRLGLKLFEYGTIVLSNMDLHREANPFVEALTKVSGEAVHLCVFDGMQTTIIDRTEPERSQRHNTIVVLEASPAHCTSTGKVALAFQGEEVIRKVIAMGLRRYTANTITDPESLLNELDLIRRRGYAIDNEEKDVGIRCVGAPIRNLSGRVFAAMSVSGPARRITPARTEQLAPMVMHYAGAISAQLGYRQPGDADRSGRVFPIDLDTSSDGGQR
ncbi:IclR family transcriptional regulator [Shumkonia mesophila]|uniref:IclR family transcriptional regulator n=1 Tax=Shumkonia mesophila TaxID=2838854 RepID=UPI002934D3DB|nr:IclR family transcriptional regulator [Shumkonia mesophila]